MAGNSLCICSKTILYFTCKGFLQLLLLVYAIFKILSIQREFLQLARAWVVWGKGKKNRNCRRKNSPSKRGRGGRWGGNSASPEQKIEAAPPPARSEQRGAKNLSPFKRFFGVACESEIVKSILLGGER